MKMNREVTYNWKSQVLLLIGALLINVMLVSGVKADGPLKEKDIEKQPYRMADLGAAKFLSTEKTESVDDTKVGRTGSFINPISDVRWKDLKPELSKVSEEDELVLKSGFVAKISDIVLGNSDSEIVIVEYFSPTCLHCVNYHKRIFPEIKKKFIDTGRVQYIVREFIGNKQDLDATLLARCSGDQDSYFKFKDVILEKQDSWAYSKNYREILTNIGVVGGVSAEQYAMCLNDKSKIKDLIENTKLLAKEPRFIGTPAFFINGKQFTKQYTVEELAQAINAEEEDLKRFKARMSSSETKEMIKILQEVNREVNRMAISSDRIEIAALSPEIKKTLEELNEWSRRLNEYEYSRGT